MFEQVVKFVKNKFSTDNFIPLHEPRFKGNEKKYVLEAIDSTYVSSVGKFVDCFEEMMRDYTGASFAVATMNGTAALHMGMILAGVKRGELVLTQPFSFIATCNAISYIGAEPLFIDISKTSLGLSIEKLREFLSSKVRVDNNFCYHEESGKRIAACVPMHTFGHVHGIDELVELCNSYHIPVVEDAAESLGSTYKGKQTGTFGLLGTFSFNGNKTITAGGGGVVVTNNEKLGKLAKHLTTQAKVPHRWEFSHDHIGYNYRLPNLNAALVCAQMEMLDTFIAAKRQLAADYETFFASQDILFCKEPEGCRSNYWLNAVLLKNREERNNFLQYTNDHQVMTRPAWNLMTRLPMFENCFREDISDAEWIEDRLVNIPSSVI